jgi:PAS domain S-box-containing protein
MSNSTIIAKEMLFTHKFDHGSEPMFIIKDKCFIDCNSSALELLKVKNKTDFLNKHPSEISPEYQPDGVISYIKAEEMIAKSYKNGKHIFPWVHRNSCNENFTVQVTLIDVSIDNEKYLHVTFNIIQEDKISSSNRKFYPFLNKVLNENLKDECKNYTSETMNNYNLLNEHKKAIDVSAIVSKTNTEGVITYVNELFCQTSGYSVKELIGKKHNMVLHPDMPKSIFKDLWATISQGKVWHGIIKNKNKSGGFYYVDTTVNSILDIDGNIKEYIAIRYDITAIYSKDEIINYQNTDQVTQLANHTKLLSDISEKESLYLAIIKIPELENIQSAYITEVHNEALNEIAKYLSSNFPNNYQIYRCSANMFAVTLANNVDFEHFINQCSTVQLDFEQQLIKTQENDFLLSMFIGVANSECTETIYKNALMALMSGKKNNTKLTIYDKRCFSRQLSPKLLSSLFVLLWI